MKKRKWISILLIALAITVTGLMSACGTDSGKTDSDTPETQAEDIAQEDEEVADEGSEPIDVSWYTENNTAFCDGVYFVGKDIAAGNYILTCVDSSWAMEITVFENEENYYGYHKTSRFTVGEESDAKAQYAMINTTIWPDETYSLNIQDGYVVKIESGKGTLVSADGGAAPEASSTGKTKKIMDGLYMPGNIASGTYMITCTETNYAMQVLVFKDKAAYDDYVKEDPFTVGEAQNAIELHALSDFYIKQGDTAYINLDDDMVVSVDGGSGFIEPVAMSWAK